ncbi:hypothetical protein GCM10027402_28420 [Arthrobacter monumenti]
MISLKWNDDSGTSGLPGTRIFLVAYGLAAMVFLMGLVPADLWGRRESLRTWSPLPAWMHYLAAGLLTGLAIGITDWHNPHPAESMHLWWTFFMATGLLAPQADNRRNEKEERGRLEMKPAARIQ